MRSSVVSWFIPFLITTNVAICNELNFKAELARLNSKLQTEVFWFGRSTVGDNYKPGDQVSMLLFDGSRSGVPLHGFCSAELEHCSAYSTAAFAPSYSLVIDRASSLAEAFRTFVESTLRNDTVLFYRGYWQLAISTRSKETQSCYRSRHPLRCSIPPQILDYWRRRGRCGPRCCALIFESPGDLADSFNGCSFLRDEVGTMMSGLSARRCTYMNRAEVESINLNDPDGRSLAASSTKVEPASAACMIRICQARATVTPRTHVLPG